MEEKKRGGDSVDGGIDGNGEGSGAAAELASASPGSVACTLKLKVGSEPVGIS